eukprot:scaffold256_cov261-Pinguiococcus_pyrenoidosus.AAC.43
MHAAHFPDECYDGRASANRSRSRRAVDGQMKNSKKSNQSLAPKWSARSHRQSLRSDHLARCCSGQTAAG